MLINDQIKVREVLVIGPNGEQVGVKSIDDARTLASYAALDLVLISPNANPPVCKVMDYNKFRYEKKKKAKAELPKPKEYNIDGYTVYVGKNNKQNDYLTLKMARSHDMWLHTKNIPGSHVIIVKKYDEEIPDKIIIEAAKLAALNSKAKSGAKTPVDFTEVKNVKKPSGAKPGMVIYDNYNTTYVSQ